MCKLFALEAVGRVTDKALLVHGGLGYLKSSRIEMLYRDARLNWLERAPTIHKLIIARTSCKKNMPPLAVVQSSSREESRPSRLGVRLAAQATHQVYYRQNERNPRTASITSASGCWRLRAPFAKRAGYL